MGFIEKLKLLFKVQKPINDTIVAVKEAKKTKKWIHFAVTMFAIVSSTVGALTGVIPPQVQLIIATVAQALYNIVRGADKADDNEVKGTLTSTEFWTTAATEIQKGIVAVQVGGVNPEWLAASSTAIGFLLSFGQNLAARAPDPTGESKGLTSAPTAEAPKSTT